MTSFIRQLLARVAIVAAVVSASLPAFAVTITDSVAGLSFDLDPSPARACIIAPASLFDANDCQGIDAARGADAFSAQAGDTVLLAVVRTADAPVIMSVTRGADTGGRVTQGEADQFIRGVFRAAYEQFSTMGTFAGSEDRLVAELGDWRGVQVASGVIAFTRNSDAPVSLVLQEREQIHVVIAGGATYTMLVRSSASRESQARAIVDRVFRSLHARQTLPRAEEKRHDSPWIPAGFVVAVAIGVVGIVASLRRKKTPTATPPGDATS